MDEMKLKLSSKFMRNIVSKILSKMIYKKLGYKVNIQFNELNVDIVDGETKISANVEASFNSNEFKNIMKAIESKVEESI